MKKLLCALGVMLLVLLNPNPSSALPTGMGIGEEGIPEILEFIVSTGLGDELLDFATKIGVGVEREAAGIQPNPLSDLIHKIEEKFGPVPAAIIDGAFDRLIEELGPSLLADVPPIHLPPEFDINNARADVASVNIPIGPYIVDIGTTENVGDGEFARVVLGLVDSDGDDNDIEQILNEITTGVSGANLDFEQIPGIVGVDLISYSDACFILGLEDAGFIDRLTFTGPGTEAVLAKFDFGDGGAHCVPEPGTIVLLGAGFISIAGLRRKDILK